ncbi:segregation and condensation protein A [Bifidobacterium aquikefiri]|uniref:Segregation and condensation protein A n=1 Tax=Bifidobacterium aquikefiri TaxID=1653207 RepID=A0A261G1L8_9BIFI|nr:chromosome segregation protein ScpA [Bifidobacterium aquikefiri]
METHISENQQIASDGTSDVSVMENDINVEFSVNLDVYQGPFDALLGLLARRSLDLTELSLCEITQEFLDFVQTLDMNRNIDTVSAFIDVASILIEAKSAALLPHTESSDHDEQTLQALRDRDLLFARLLQYKAFKEAGNNFRERLAANSGFFPHHAVVTEQVASMLPELQWSTDAFDLARLAARALMNAPPEEVSLAQLHVPQVNLQAQAAMIRERLMSAEGDACSFEDLICDATSRLEIIARFFAVLVFFKQGFVQYRQAGPFASLSLRWVAKHTDGAALPVDAGDFA